MPRRSLTNANPLGLEQRKGDRSWSTICICTLKLWTLVTTYWLQCFQLPCCAAISCSHLPVLFCLSQKLFDLFLYFCHKSYSELDWARAVILPNCVCMTRLMSDKLTWFGPWAMLQGLVGEIYWIFKCLNRDDKQTVVSGSISYMQTSFIEFIKLLPFSVEEVMLACETEIRNG